MERAKEMDDFMDNMNKASYVLPSPKSALAQQDSMGEEKGGFSHAQLVEVLSRQAKIMRKIEDLSNRLDAMAASIDVLIERSSTLLNISSKTSRRVRSTEPAVREMCQIVKRMCNPQPPPLPPTIGMNNSGQDLCSEPSGEELEAASAPLANGSWGVGGRRVGWWFAVFLVAVIWIAVVTGVLVAGVARASSPGDLEIHRGEHQGAATTPVSTSHRDRPETGSVPSGPILGTPNDLPEPDARAPGHQVERSGPAE